MGYSCYRWRRRLDEEHRWSRSTCFSGWFPARSPSTHGRRGTTARPSTPNTRTSTGATMERGSLLKAACAATASARKEPKGPLRKRREPAGTRQQPPASREPNPQNRANAPPGRWATTTAPAHRDLPAQRVGRPPDHRASRAAQWTVHRQSQSPDLRLDQPARFAAGPPRTSLPAANLC